MSAHLEQECPECNRRTQHIAEDGIPICLACGYPRVKYDSQEGQAARETEHGQIMACLREDARKGERGGGSRSGGRKKDKKGGKSPQSLDRDDAESKTIELLRGPRRNVMSVPGVRESADVIRAAIAAKLLGEI